MPEPALLPLRDALVRYPGISLETARRLIRDGKLPAVLIGRIYLVSPADVAKLFAPKLRNGPAPRKPRESETARAERQLTEAGLR